jgi:hypothetical protein
MAGRRCTEERWGLLAREDLMRDSSLRLQLPRIGQGAGNCLSLSARSRRTAAKLVFQEDERGNESHVSCIHLSFLVVWLRGCEFAYRRPRWASFYLCTNAQSQAIPHMRAPKFGLGTPGQRA